MENRRSFVKKSIIGVAGIGLSASVLSPYLSAQSKKKLGVALVGLGYYSTDLLAPALQMTDNCYLAGIVTGAPAKAEKWQKKYDIPDKNIYNYQNFDTIANNPDIDVVYVVLPTSMHAEYTIRAANAGKHVWCEKPMAVTASDCQKMIDACEKNKVKLSIGYRMQHEPNTRKIINYRKKNIFGSINLIQASAGYYDGRTDHWKFEKEMGGGAMYDMGVYPLNATRYVAGEEPISVMAQHFTNRPEIFDEVDETTLFQLEFPSGAVANCATSFGMSMNDLHVTCKNGWYKLNPFQAYSGIKGSASNGDILNASIPNQQALQMDNDAKAIFNDKAVLVPGEEGLKDIRVVEAIYKSAKEGNSVQI
ncbi:Gfo/Idh/MocA family oxidoreductase [Marivirga tractuosa]|uniref:Gfo/Idh/MocA family protein n=1 Tax=Marivirga tractuosa TaxID=1006 RepID=UPI0035CF5A95